MKKSSEISLTNKIPWRVDFEGKKKEWGVFRDADGKIIQMLEGCYCPKKKDRALLERIAHTFNNHDSLLKAAVHGIELGESLVAHGFGGIQNAKQFKQMRQAVQAGS